MIGEVIAVGELKLRDGADLDQYKGLGERMYGIVSRQAQASSNWSMMDLSERLSFTIR